MKKFKFGIISILLVFVLIGCNSDDENETAPEEDNDEDTSETTETDSDTDDTSNESSEANDGEVLSLGETGAIESTLGDYEITFESFQTVDELEGYNNDGEVYVLVDATVTNTGDEPLNGEDLYTSRLYDDTGSSYEDSLFFETPDLMEGTIEPGETMEGQFVFNASESSESFELVYNHSYGAVATVVTWEFTADEASN